MTYEERLNHPQYLSLKAQGFSDQTIVWYYEPSVGDYVPKPKDPRCTCYGQDANGINLYHSVAA